MRRLFLLALLVGCGTTSPDARLAALPQVPSLLAVPVLPPELAGLTFHVVARMDVPGPSGASAARVEACAASFEHWMGLAGWRPVRDPNAPVDLVIEEHCTPPVATTRYGDRLEIRHPEALTLAIVVQHDGAEVVTVPRGPADYVCASSGAPREISADCMARSERWAQVQIIRALAASEPLAQLARQLKAAR
jgi:hypothetical protein